MPYHHGDLRNALIDAAVAGARSGGPDAVLLRDAARHAGVSHNAGYRHFANRDELLAAVAARGLRELALRVEAATDGLDPDLPAADRARAALRASGRAYIEYARAEPGMFRTVFACAADPTAGPIEGSEGDSGLGPYELLGQALDDLVAAGVLSAGRRPYSDVVAWSAVHGLSVLLIEGPLATLPDEEVETAMLRLFAVMDEGL